MNNIPAQIIATKFLEPGQRVVGAVVKCSGGRYQVARIYKMGRRNPVEAAFLRLVKERTHEPDR